MGALYICILRAVGYLICLGSYIATSATALFIWMIIRSSIISHVPIASLSIQS